MNPRFKEFLKPLALKILNLGLDLRKIYSFKHYLRYRKEKNNGLPKVVKLIKVMLSYQIMMTPQELRRVTIFIKIY